MDYRQLISTTLATRANWPRTMKFDTGVEYTAMPLREVFGLDRDEGDILADVPPPPPERSAFEQYMDIMSEGETLSSMQLIGRLSGKLGDKRTSWLEKFVQSDRIDDNVYAAIVSLGTQLFKLHLEHADPADFQQAVDNAEEALGRLKKKQPEKVEKFLRAIKPLDDPHDATDFVEAMGTITHQFAMQQAMRCVQREVSALSRIEKQLDLNAPEMMVKEEMGRLKSRRAEAEPYLEFLATWEQHMSRGVDQASLAGDTIHSLQQNFVDVAGSLHARVDDIIAAYEQEHGTLRGGGAGGLPGMQ